MKSSILYPEIVASYYFNPGRTHNEAALEEAEAWVKSLNIKLYNPPRTNQPQWFVWDGDERDRFAREPMDEVFYDMKTGDLVRYDNEVDEPIVLDEQKWLIRVTLMGSGYGQFNLVEKSVADATAEDVLKLMEDVKGVEGYIHGTDTAGRPCLLLIDAIMAFTVEPMPEFPSSPPMAMQKKPVEDLAGIKLDLGGGETFSAGGKNIPDDLLVGKILEKDKD